MKLKYLFLSFILIAFTGCDVDKDSLEGISVYVDIDSGDADFERWGFSMQDFAEQPINVAMGMFQSTNPGASAEDQNKFLQFMKDFGTDEVTTAVALAIDQKLKGEGFDPTTKEFYNEVDKRLQQELPHKFNSDRVMDNTGKPSQVVAGSSRKSSPIGNKVKLSKRDVELAKKWDIPLDRYAAEKRKVSKLDDGNYSTIETKRA
jgi:hypothetical protein